MEIRKIIESIRKIAGCKLEPPAGQPELPDGLALPKDLQVFYSLAGGAELFQGRPYPTTIVAPRDFVRSNPIIYPGLPADAYNEYPSKNWFILTDWVITIDLNPNRLGRCYDSFWDRHAMRGSSQVIAKSFSDLLGSLLKAKGKYPFWQRNNFRSLGDAYDDVPS